YFFTPGLAGGCLWYYQNKRGQNLILAPFPHTFSSFPCHAKTPPFLQPGGVFGKVDSPFFCCLSCFPLSSVAMVNGFEEKCMNLDICSHLYRELFEKKSVDCHPCLYLRCYPNIWPDEDVS
ncbi:MAG: hypothetical protein OSJ58_15475, partial [Dysosmobacter sp.]|uniref:hypothetical protein n=1 Tax=uncultured Oscillibacter sp. TaxID=876091 RepID=UPI002618484A